MEAQFNKLQKWIKSPQERKLQRPFFKGRPLRPLNGNKILYEIETNKGKQQMEVKITDTYQVSSQAKTFADMCLMNVLNQPQVLHNLAQRYISDEIFTYIGPTLIITNPYKSLPSLFSKQKLVQSRQLISKEQIQSQPPHVYMIAGKAYLHMKRSMAKQAIVISGESGAGKTESTKYCMQILTSLSCNGKHQIENRILSCNPLLQAFGNSKTIRNDNSSRFGKYVQIYFANDNTIKGANIHSYLLQKSRVVSIAKGQRSFHAFYALLASNKFNTQQPNKYEFLKQSDCYTANNIDDAAYFNEICKAMTQIGFTQKQQTKIWHLLKAILELGNVNFDDKQNKENQQKPCVITNKQLIKSIAQVIQITEKQLQKLLIIQKKIMIKDVMHKPYKKQGCIGHRNTLCKAIYNTIFEFILQRIQSALNPKQTHQYKSINILDIFGFQNFEKNSFQQLCINFTNQKLLKLYNQYIFKREMQILSQDGLQQSIKTITPPTNDSIISLIRTPDLKISIFSIINDNTLQQQFTDQNIKDSIQNKFKQSNLLSFRKTKDLLFLIKHSQCDVQYDISGFKIKNMDKINDDVIQLLNNFKIVSLKKKYKQEKGNTLLKKFATQIQTLVTELSSSNVHFIRCIKPNEIKKANFPQYHYMLSQVRYLGVFETIQIRKKTFPVRKDYTQFMHEYKSIFPKLNHQKHATTKKMTQQILKQIKAQKNQFMLGNKRVYLNQRVQNILNKMAYQFYKIRNQQVKKLQQVCKRFIFTSKVNRNLKLLVQRKKIWRKIAYKYTKIILKSGFSQIKSLFEKKKQLQKQKQLQKRKQLQKQKQLQNQKAKNEQILKNKNPVQDKNQVISSTGKLLLSKSKNKSQLNKIQILNKKFAKYENLVLKAYEKVCLAITFNKMKLVTLLIHNIPANLQRNNLSKGYKQLNETVIVQQADKNPNIFKLKKKQIQKIQHKQPSQSQQNKFTQSFYNQESVYIGQSSDVIFTGNLKIQMFQKTKESMEKLTLLQKILGQKYKSLYSNQGELCSPHSQDSNFKMEDCSKQIMDKVMNFPIDQFFQHVLRKRTGVFGMKKDYSEILTYKSRPLSKTLTELTNEQQTQALKIFKLLVKIGQQTALDNVFKLVDNVMRYCQQTSSSLKNQIFLQLIKQSNNDAQVPAIRIYQTMAVFLHIYSPDQDFIIAGLSIFFVKIAEKKHHQKQQQFLRYLFKKMIRKIQRNYGVGYMPIKYQIMALMSKRQISIPIYFPIGNNILVKAQSYQTFADVKNKILSDLGVNLKRIPAQFFTFFQVVNYQNTQLQQSPVSQSSVIWDVMTYWQLAKQKYNQSGVPSPYFSIMIKIKYPFQCSYDDEETIQLYFAQCYFDYSMGRIRLDVRKMAMLAACIRKVKMAHLEENDFQGCFPLWMGKVYDQQVLDKFIQDNIKYLEDNHLDNLAIKYKFLEVCAESPLALTFSIPTEHSIKLFFRPKRIFLVEKNLIVAQFSLRDLAKWSNTQQSFNFQIKRKDGSIQNKTHIIMTEYSHMCTQYLNKVSQFLIKYGGRQKKSNKNVLGGL